MKRRRIAVIIIISMVVGLFSMYSDTGLIARALTYEEKLEQLQEQERALEQQRQQAQERVNEMETRKAETEQVMQSIQKDIADVEAYIMEVDMELMRVSDELYDLETEVASTKKALAETEKELLAAEEAAAEQYEIMKRRIQYMYEHGEQNILEIFLNAESVADILNQMEYRKKITAYDNSLLERYETALALVETTKSVQEATLENLYLLQESAENEKAYYEQLSLSKGEQMEAYFAMLGVNEELYTTYSEEIENQSMTIEELERREEQLAQEEEQIIAEELERLRREEEERKRREEEERKAREAAEEAARRAAEAAAATNRLTAAEGIELKVETSIDAMIWPLPGDGRTFSGFGYRVAPIAGASTYHRGVDIGGESGASIVSVLSGTVLEAGYSATNGNYVKVDHGGGLVTGYLHCSKLLVAKGDEVLQGQVVGLVGSTGISTAPHLHFSVQINGTHVDPLLYISYEG